MPIIAHPVIRRRATIMHHQMIAFLATQMSRNFRGICQSRIRFFAAEKTHLRPALPLPRLSNTARSVLSVFFNNWPIRREINDG